MARVRVQPGCGHESRVRVRAKVGLLLYVKCSRILGLGLVLLAYFLSLQMRNVLRLALSLTHFITM